MCSWVLGGEQCYLHLIGQSQCWHMHLQQPYPRLNWSSMSCTDISVPNQSSLIPRPQGKQSGNEAISTLDTHKELELAVMGLLLAPEQPSCRQATSASVIPNESSHTVPHCSQRKISRRPDVQVVLEFDPLASLRSPIPSAAVKT